MTDWTKGSHNWHIISPGGASVLCGADNVPRSVVTKDVEMPAGDVCKKCWGELKQTESDAAQTQEDLQRIAKQTAQEEGETEEQLKLGEKLAEVKSACDNVVGILEYVIRIADKDVLDIGDIVVRTTTNNRLGQGETRTSHDIHIEYAE